MSEEINKDKDKNKDKEIDEAVDNVNEMAKNIEEMKKEMDGKLEEVLKAQATLNKAMIRDPEEEKALGHYGFLQAKKDVANGKTAKVPYWSDKTVKRYGEYLQMVAAKEPAAVINKAFGDNVQDNVSNWTPAEFRNELVRLEFVSSVMLPKVTIVPMSTNAVTMPKPSGSYTWGFVDAGGAMTDSKFTPGTMTLTTAKIYGLALVNQEDLDDPSYPLAPFVANQLGEDAAKLIDKIILYGDADPVVDAWDGKFDGWGCAASVEAVTGSVDDSPTFAELFTLDNLMDTVGKLDELEMDGAEWYFSPVGWTAIRNIQYQVSDGAGGTIASGAPLIPINAGWNYPLLGFPTNITSRVLNTATASEPAAFFGNAKYIYVGDRMDMRIDLSEHYKFANDQVVFRGLQRLAVTVGLPSSIAKISFGADS